MTTPDTLRAACDQLRNMVAHGIKPTAHELLTLATMFEQAAAQMDGAVELFRFPAARTAFSVIQGGLNGQG